MALRLNRSSSQYLYSALSGLSARYPLTLMGWYKRQDTSTYATETVLSVGDVDVDDYFVSIHTRDSEIRAIAFNAYSEADADFTPDTSTYHHLVGVFTNGYIYCYHDGELVDTVAWTPAASTPDQIRIGQTVSATYSDLGNIYVEHVAAWDVALTADEIGDLYDQTVSPADTQSSNLLTYTPLIDSLDDETENLTWTTVNITTPSYESSGISYGGTTYTVTYDGNSNTSGTAPTDANSPYDSGATVTTLTNSGSLARTGYVFKGWNTAANGGGTHYNTGATFTISANTTLYAEWAATYTVTYDDNDADSGTAPTDGSSPYETGSTVTVIGNTGSLARTNYTFEGWNTAVDGSGTHYNASGTFTISANTTLYAEWSADYQYRTIDHTNFDPSDYTDAEIAYAAMKKVYFEHASTGQDIVGDSDADSSTGYNYDDSANCGLALLYAEDSRYLCDRDSHESGNDSTWFSTHGGLQDNNRGNPTPANKIGGFVGLSAAMRAVVEIAMFKYCWIDVWTETSGYISDGAAAAASDIEDIEAFEAANTGITVVYWTMPLQDDASYAAREAYNAAIREYCLDNGKWLLDIADIECHNADGVKQVDGNSREIATTAYMRDDGGHLGTTGRLRLAQAYWSLIAAIANDGGSATYTVGGVTYNKNGSVLGGCTVSLFKHAGSGVFSYVATTTSDASTGAYSFVTADNDTAYMVVAFKGDSPHVFDVSDYNLQPELTEP
jgi:uncharacterized repeat protein (TIGR02543 family)